MLYQLGLQEINHRGRGHRAVLGHDRAGRTGGRGRTKGRRWRDSAIKEVPPAVPAQYTKAQEEAERRPGHHGAAQFHSWHSHSLRFQLGDDDFVRLRPHLREVII